MNNEELKANEQQIYASPTRQPQQQAQSTHHQQTFQISHYHPHIPKLLLTSKTKIQCIILVMLLLTITYIGWVFFGLKSTCIMNPSVLQSLRSIQDNDYMGGHIRKHIDCNFKGGYTTCFTGGWNDILEILQYYLTDHLCKASMVDNNSNIAYDIELGRTVRGKVKKNVAVLPIQQNQNRVQITQTTRQVQLDSLDRLSSGMQRSSMKQTGLDNMSDTFCDLYNLWCFLRYFIRIKAMQKAFQLTLKIGKIPVFSLPHIEQNVLSKVQNCKKFKDYTQKFNNLEKGVEISKIEIVGVEMFGDNVGFVNMRAITSKDGFKLPGYVFLRGHAVAILMFVNEKLLLVEQYRVPIQETMLEAPAGMIDESGDFVGMAAKEIEEETSIKIKKEQLKPMGSFYPSCGGSDQEIFLYYCQVNIDENELKKIEEKIHGEGDHQRIRIRLIDYDPQLILKTKDSKLVYALYAYEHLIKGKTSAPSL